jgi:DNA-binding NarL/FixJ family response regulator
MFFRAAAELLGIDGDNALAADALLAAQRICSNLPEEMQACFQAAEPVRLVYKLTGPSASRPAPRPSYPDCLSQREVEVLGLIAAGKSNREIAEALVLSVRTVERHIANIYGKTGVRTKAQATAYALRHNLS